MLTHLSLILLLAGVLLGSLLGFRDDSFAVVEGTAREIGHGTGLELYLRSFADTYWEDGTPKDYRSYVTIYQDGEPAKAGTIRVNHPLSYRGVRVHQGYFGPAAALTVADGDGNAVYHGAAALTGTRTTDSLRRPVGEIILPDNRGRVVILMNASNGADPYIEAGQAGLELYDKDGNFIGWLLLDENKPQELDGLRFTYESRRYSGLLVSKNPGVPLIWAAAALLLLSIAAHVTTVVILNP